MKALISQMEEEIRNAHGIADLLHDRVCKLERGTDSLYDQAAESYGFSDDDAILNAVTDMMCASSAMKDALRDASNLVRHLAEAKASLQKAQKGIK